MSVNIFEDLYLDSPYFLRWCSTSFSVTEKPISAAITGMNLCIPPYILNDFAASDLYTFNPLFKSLNFIPNSKGTTNLLKSLEDNIFKRLSCLFFLQPVTRSY